MKTEFVTRCRPYNLAHRQVNQLLGRAYVAAPECRQRVQPLEVAFMQNAKATNLHPYNHRSRMGKKQVLNQHVATEEGAAEANRKEEPSKVVYIG